MIDKFNGKYRWLSNFWLSPVTLAGKVYPSVENAYQAAKFPKDQRDQFLYCSPGIAKEIGQTAVLRENWDKEKLQIMKQMLSKKFEIGSYNADLLVKTGKHRLVEGNNWGDVFWGVCDGQGENFLGIILMNIRRKLVIHYQDQPDLKLFEKYTSRENNWQK